MAEMAREREALHRRLKGYLERDPENWGLRAQVFDAALAAGDRDEARAQLAHALARLPEDPGWLHRKAMLLLAEGRHAEAQAVLEALLAQGSDAPAIRHNLGYALFAQGQWERASETLAPLLELADEGAAGAPALWLRCQHHLDRLEEGLATFRRLQAARPLPAAAAGVASLMALDEGALGEALRLSDTALDERPDQMEAMVTRATLALARQDAEVAVDWYGRALRISPDDGRTWAGLGAARMLAQDFSGALEAFARSVRTAPDHQGTWIAYGWCQIFARDYPAARACFERAVEIDRTIAEAHGGLAVALARLGARGEAEHEAEVSFRLDPENLSGNYARAVLSGEADRPGAFLEMAGRVLSRRPTLEGMPGGGTLADLVFDRARKKAGGPR